MSLLTKRSRRTCMYIRWANNLMYVSAYLYIIYKTKKSYLEKYSQESLQCFFSICCITCRNIYAINIFVYVHDSCWLIRWWSIAWSVCHNFWKIGKLHSMLLSDQVKAPSRETSNFNRIWNILNFSCKKLLKLVNLF